MEFSAIGFMKSVFLYKNGTPRQASVCQNAIGSITIKNSIFNNPQHSLHGLEEYSHVWIFFIFHQNNNCHFKAKVRPPRLGGKKLGVFATRSPYRPNPIGLTLAKLEEVNGPTLYLSGIDILDGTPIIDIKPFIPDYDNPSTSLHETNSSKSLSHDFLQSEQSRGNFHNTSDNETNLTENGDSNMSPNMSSEATSTTIPNDLSLQLVEKCWNVNDQDIQIMEDGLDLSKSLDCVTSSVDSDNDADSFIQCKDTQQIDFESQSSQKDIVHNSRKTRNNLSYPVEDHTEIASCKLFNKLLFSENEKKSENVSVYQTDFVHANIEDSDGVDKTKFNKEEITPPSLIIKTAKWLRDLSQNKVTVRFTPTAIDQLRLFSSDTTEKYRMTFLQNSCALKAAITEILEGDPRSIYRKKSCEDSLYYFTVDVVHITCWFDVDLVEVVRIKPIVDVEALKSK